MDEGGSIAILEEGRSAGGRQREDVRLGAVLDGGVGGEVRLLLEAHPGDPHLAGAHWGEKKRMKLSRK